MMSTKPSRSRWILGITTALVFASGPRAGAGVWTNLVGGNASGSWGAAANWSGGIPNATGAIADFSTLNLAFHSTVTNDAVRTVGTLKFDDLTPGNNWTLTGSALTLATSSGAPTIDVAGSSQTTTLSAGLAGNQGFVKSGAGKLLLSGGTANTIGGTIVLTNGQIQTPNGASLKNVTATIVVATGAELRVGGNFDNNANSCPLVLNGTGDGNGNEGTLHGSYNQTLNGPITLNSDSKISHDWNLFTLNGAITAASGSNNLEMAITVGGQATLAANGNVNLGLGTLMVSSVAGGAPVTLGGSNTLGGVGVQANGTIVFGSVNAIGGSGPRVAIQESGTAALSGTDLNPLLARVVTNSSGAIAFNGANSSTALNFGNYTNLSLGSVGSSTYSGVLTPGGGNYQLGGGGGTLTVSSGLTSPEAGLVVNGNTSSSTVILTGSHTYTNTTVITGGTLMVTGVLSGPVVVESGGTLAVGVATATLGTLTVSNSVVLGGSSVFAINRSGAQKADRLVASSLVLDGTITVTNVGAAPVLGDSFQLFGITGAISNAQPALNLPPLAGGLKWDVSRLTVDGTIAVAQLTNVVGQTNWPSLLPQEIESAYNAGYSNVTVNPGTYVMKNGNGPAFTFSGWNNFTINASNTLFLVDTGYVMYAAQPACFNFYRCTNVTLAGATVRSKVYPFTQGRVIAIGTNSGVLYCNWQISAGYPTNDFNWWFNAVHASNSVVNLEQGDIYYENRYGTNSSGVANNAVYLGNRTWQLKFPGWLTSFSFRTNDWLVARAGGQGFAYYLNDSTNCTLRACVSQTGGFATFREHLGGGNRILDCLIQPAAVPPVDGTELPVVACAADGLHTTWTYPGLYLENFVCQGVFLDDCVTIHGGNNDVVSASGNTVTFDGPGKFVVGDPVRIYSTNGNYFTQANCTAIQNLGDGTYKLTLDRSLAIPGGTAGENPRCSGSGYKVINCQLGNVRSRAILNKADNGLVTGCIIQNASTAMTFGPEVYWGGGGYSWDLNITNNTILNCGRGIFFDTAGAIGNLNNTIRNNYFRDVALGRALHFNSCGTLTIDGNYFVNPAPDYNLIYLSQTTNIVLLRNFVTNQTSAISLVGTGSGVSGLNYTANGIISAGPKRLVNQSSGLVLDGGVSPVVQNAPAGALNPVFTLQPVGNGYCAFSSGNQVLDTGNATNAGSSLQVNAYTGGDGQLWSLWPVGTTNVVVINKLSGLAADVTSTSAGTTVIQSVINTNATDMQWYLQVFNGSAFQSGVWVQLVGGNASGVWGTNANWSGGLVAGGTDAVADFSTNNITVNSIVTNDTARAIGGLRFNNTTAGRFWNVDGSTNRQLTLATSSGQPSINVTNTQVFLGGFNGTQGFIKNGNGVLNIFGSTYFNVVSGPILVNAGSLTTASGNAFKNITGDITVAAGATFGANANFDGAIFSNNIYLSGTGVGVPPGYVNSNTPIPTSPTAEIYYASTMPWGALDIYGNATLRGTITLNTDSKITHSWNFGTINGPTIATGAGKNLELRTYQSGQPNLIINGSISLGTGALTVTGAGTQGVTLGNSNNFSGGAYLTAGVLKLGHPNALGSGPISVAGGATLDVTGLGSPFVLGASQNLSNGVSGTGIINGSFDASGGTVSVTYNNGTPALAVSSGTLTLSGTTAFTINNTGPALAPGTYPIISTSGAGAVGGVEPALVNVLGGGLSGSATASLQVSGGTLNLVVANAVPPTPTILPVYRDRLGNIVIRTETTVGFDYLLLSTTSLTPPVIWITNSTTAGTGGTITNAVPILQAPPKQFFRYVLD